ncbi:phosphate transporter [Natrialba taiwanensis DSM 12281]|uniref:Phosphate transporter n=1 Tax=Natrialba taiwanensis DSM 12281 TaxID=1230458 RepID=L9ZME7_9EURY|nr:phosphate transporter [Natrialba taiwanensis DSM 12281]
MPKIDEEDPVEMVDADDLVRPNVIARVVSFCIIGPVTSVGLSYGFFVLVPL